MLKPLDKPKCPMSPLQLYANGPRGLKDFVKSIPLDESSALTDSEICAAMDGVRKMARMFRLRVGVRFVLVRNGPHCWRRRPQSRKVRVVRRQRRK